MHSNNTVVALKTLNNLATIWPKSQLAKPASKQTPLTKNWVRKKITKKNNKLQHITSCSSNNNKQNILHAAHYEHLQREPTKEENKKTEMLH